jgi:transcriptional regulator with XRE-family HTH domain
MPTIVALHSKEKELVAASQRAIQMLDAAFNVDTLEGMVRLLQVVSAGHVVLRKGRRVIQKRARPHDVLAWAIGQRIKAARERKGWLQENLADESGIARANIARLESGRHAAHLSTLRRVAAALDLKVDSLLKAPEPVSAQEGRHLTEAGIDEWAEQLDKEDKV